jgi:lipoate-protein ligase A
VIDGAGRSQGPANVLYSDYKFTGRCTVLFVEFSPASTAGQLALDEALLDRREREPGDGFLRFWEPSEPCVVLGRTNSADREVRLDRCRSLGIPVFRRSSGGGTVVQGPGCLNFSLVLNTSADSRLANASTTNDYVLERHAGVISTLTGEKVRVSGSSDLTIGGRKISGNAQRRRLRSLLFHGCILLDFDIALIEELLPLPSRQPAYREGRPHTEFLRNLRISAEGLKRALRDSWGATLPAADLPLDEMERLVKERHLNPSWTYN